MINSDCEELPNSDNYTEKSQNSRKKRNRVQQENVSKVGKTLKQCPLCKKEGRDSVINIYQVTDDTALKICSYRLCVYPVGTNNKLDVKRNVYNCQLSEEDHKYFKLQYTPGAPKTIAEALKLLWTDFENKQEQLHMFMKRIELNNLK